jgi:hypothetical protein
MTAVKWWLAWTLLLLVPALTHAQSLTAPTSTTPPRITRV